MHDEVCFEKVCMSTFIISRRRAGDPCIESILDAQACALRKQARHSGPSMTRRPTRVAMRGFASELANTSHDDHVPDRAALTCLSFNNLNSFAPSTSADPPLASPSMAISFCSTL